MKIKIDVKSNINLAQAVKEKIEKSEFELKCTCGHKFKKKIGWLKNNPNNIRCPSCNVAVLVNADKIRDMLGSLK